MDAPRFQRLDGDVVSCQPWTAPLEGPYTQVAKIALVNALDPRALCELLFGRKLLPSSFAELHGRSFINGIWAAATTRGAAGRAVLPGFLTQLCGGWATAIAGDARLRLCRTCADVGYQSALFQIDALSACPLHGEPLIDACPHCRMPTPRYALSTEAFLTPMLCPACGNGYGRAWNGTADFSSWTGPGDMGPLLRLAAQLQSWQYFQLEWPSVSSWTDDPTVEPTARRRALVFNALATLSDTAANGSDALIWRSTPCESTLHLRSAPDFQPRIAIYKAIRRHVLRQFGLRRERGSAEGSFYVHRVNEAIVPKRSACSPGLHAFALWTSRCEDQPNVMSRWLAGRQASSYERRLRLRTSLLLWPTDVRVDDRTWGHFVWSCFLEDLCTARRWQVSVATLGDPLEADDQNTPTVQKNRSEFLARLTRWAPKLSPLMEVLPSGISHFTWQQGRGPRQLHVVTIPRSEGAWHAKHGQL